MRASALVFAAASIVVSSPAFAAPSWVGDHEGNNLDQWDYKLFEKYIGVVENDYGGGQYAARIELHDDAEWQNGLRRVELHHTPADGLTDEGATLYFAWSFFLEQTLPTDPSQQIAYWETDQSYQQMMAFEVRGEDITFSTRRPQNNVMWEGDGRATANEWHRIAMKIVWSTDDDVGEVDVWYDGEQVVTGGKAQTLADQNRTFTQMGILRGDADFDDTPVILIDDAVEGPTLADVRPDLPSTGEGGAGATAAIAVTSSGATNTVAAAATSGAAQNGSGAGATTGAGGAGGGGETDEGGCRLSPSGTESALDVGALFAIALGAIGLGRRRARR